MKRTLITLLSAIFSIFSFAQKNMLNGTYFLEKCKVSTVISQFGDATNNYYDLFSNNSDIVIEFDDASNSMKIYQLQLVQTILEFKRKQNTQFYVVDEFLLEGTETRIGNIVNEGFKESNVDYIKSIGTYQPCNILLLTDTLNGIFVSISDESGSEIGFFITSEKVSYLPKGGSKSSNERILTVMDAIGRFFRFKDYSVLSDKESEKRQKELERELGIETQPALPPKDSQYSDYSYSYLKDSYFINTTAVYPDSRTGEDKMKKVSLAIVGDKESFAISCKELGVQAFLIQPFNYKMTKRISGGNTYYHIDFAHESSTVLNKKGDIRISLVKSSSSSNEFWINVWRMDGSDSEPYVLFPASSSFNATCIKHSKDKPTSVSYSSLFNQLLKHFYYMAYKSGNPNAFK